MIDKRSPVAAYEQLIAKIRAGVALLADDEPIPSLQEMTIETGLSMGTVQKSVQVLKDEGVIYSVRGRGMFVAPRSG